MALLRPQAAGLYDTLSNTTAPMTLFAPRNEAFEAYLAGANLTVADLIMDIPSLTTVRTQMVGVAGGIMHWLQPQAGVTRDLIPTRFKAVAAAITSFARVLPA